MPRRAEYSPRFQAFNFNSDGSFAGVTKVNPRIVSWADGNSYTAVATFEIYDLAGNLRLSGCGAETATRLADDLREEFVQPRPENSCPVAIAAAPNRRRRRAALTGRMSPGH